MKRILNIDCGDSWTTMWMNSIPLNCTQKMVKRVNFMLCIILPPFKKAPVYPQSHANFLLCCLLYILLFLLSYLDLNLCEIDFGVKWKTGLIISVFLEWYQIYSQNLLKRLCFPWCCTSGYMNLFVALFSSLLYLSYLVPINALLMTLFL